MTPKTSTDEHSPSHPKRLWSIYKGGAQLHRCSSRDTTVAEADALKAKTLREGGLLL